MGADDQGKKIKSLENAFNIIEILGQNEPMTLTELADTLPHSKSSVHYYLRTLEQEGCVMDSDAGYVLGDLFLDLGGHVLESLPIYTRGRQVAEQLAEETGHRAQLVAKRGHRTTVVYRSDAGDAAQGMRVGVHPSLASSAFSKAILSHQPSEHVDQVLDRAGAIDPTTHSRDELAAEFEKVREYRLAFEDETRKVKTRAIAAPVFPADTGRASGAIGIIGSKSDIQNPYKGTKARRFTDDVASQVSRAAQNLSDRLQSEPA